ncbi:antilisterial bacteriocin subtilosin biosynthesis protein AlbB [Bacillus vallismortis]|uniref:antilisterial bacteriocin subtilosin biosynthesis protein AlbB n=1 Tax=Bacillus vallismortis TaxID=72361 RepID=UPI000288E2DF|nr:antilisterial bacteriocin subtilosin biosynthesis protein AlbB [Bacillus vallismortis]MBG9770627.1 antibiotic biosynthesis protein AlbB [Bacillus vallismortis]MCI3983559.1 bacteriocin biosynthesis protein AlbB [Bacillus vallismortis]MCY8310637.1 bacteriocin biosynthesis protein AlbB [Bacillus vallismortis]MCY8425532.1 bacteriocin biosynthesis protein AlbB [Bacillus vallismortis]MCY8533983.1 bacteriocin biosynthesis protein AlbB [Bacillus vallismortis]
MSSAQRRLLLYLLSFIFVIGAVVYFVKSDYLFTVIFIAIAILFGMRARKADSR